MARINAPKQQPLIGSIINSILAKRFGKPFPTLQLLGHNPNYPIAYGLMANNFSNSRTQLPNSIKRLATQLVAQLNQCSFCIDLGQRMATEEQLNLEKMLAVLGYQNNPIFDESEKAALQYAFETTQVTARVCEETFSALKQHFSDTQILELTVCVAAENFYNRLTAPLEIESQGFCAIGRHS
jgi:AhpD family alkylhydroperoxidase